MGELCLSVSLFSSSSCSSATHPLTTELNALLCAVLWAGALAQFQENSTIRRLEIDRIEWLLR